MNHTCPHCKTSFNCVIPGCQMGITCSCFVCYAKYWHVPNEPVLPRKPAEVQQLQQMFHGIGLDLTFGSRLIWAKGTKNELAVTVVAPPPGHTKRFIWLKDESGRTYMNDEARVLEMCVQD